MSLVACIHSVFHVCMVQRYRPSAGLFPVIVSQDCGHQPTADIIASYGSRLTHIKASLSSCSLMLSSLIVMLIAHQPQQNSDSQESEENKEQCS